MAAIILEVIRRHGLVYKFLYESVLRAVELKGLVES